MCLAVALWLCSDKAQGAIVKLELLVGERGIHKYPQAIRGNIRSFCQTLHEELLTSGYSLTLEDIEMLAIQDVELMASWSRLDCQIVKNIDDIGIYPFIELTLDISLLADEWAVILPVVRSHCDLLQARRMEGSQSLGVQAFGMGSSEASQNYAMLIEQMKKEAFWCEPFSLDLGN